MSNKSDQSWKSLKDDIHVGASHSKKRTNINCSSFAEGDHGRTSVHGKHDKETAKPICFSSERVKSDSLISSKLKNSSDAFGAHHVSSHKHTTVTKRKRIENPSGTSTIAGTKRSKKYLNEDSGGGFNASIASFEDALGFNDKPSVKKKKTNVPVNKVKKIEVPLCTVEKEVKSTSSIMPFNVSKLILRKYTDYILLEGRVQTYIPENYIFNLSGF